MGRYALVTEEMKKKFQKDFLFEGLEWEEYGGTGDLISNNVDIAADTYPIYTSYFLQAGLSIPFDPLLVDFLYITKLHIGQLAHNSVKTIIGIVEINRRFRMQFDFLDIKYCYNFRFSKSEGRWSLKGRTGEPSFKYMFNDSVIIKGNVEPDPVGHPVPKHLGSPCS